MSETLTFENGGEVTKFEIPTPTLYVAVFFYPGSDNPWGSCSNDKNDLIKQMYGWHGVDRTRPIRIYTINV